MPPVQVYSASPINASKASEPAPKTQDANGSPAKPANSGVLPNAGAAGIPPAPSGHRPPGPAAYPAAQPSLPVQTEMPLSNGHPPVYPTRTIAADTGRDGQASPPAPQPGAVPIAAGAETRMPPPPKAGEAAAAIQAEQAQAQASITPAPQMPPQMAYLAPSAALPIQGRSSTTTTMPPAQMGGPYPSPLAGANQSSGGYSHPSGYQQNVGAAGFNQYPGQSQRDSVGDSQNSSTWSSAASGEEEGVWDTARRWASAAGESLAAAESEVWKKINKGS